MQLDTWCFASFTFHCGNCVLTFPRVPYFSGRETRNLLFSWTEIIRLTKRMFLGHSHAVLSCSRTGLAGKNSPFTAGFVIVEARESFSLVIRRYLVARLLGWSTVVDIYGLDALRLKILCYIFFFLKHLSGIFLFWNDIKVVKLKWFKLMRFLCMSKVVKNIF